MYPYLITDNTITIVSDKPHTISRDNPEWENVLGLIQQGYFDLAIDAMSPAKVLEAYTAGNLVILGDIIYRNGEIVEHAVVPHILTLKDTGMDVMPMLRFLDRLLANPSARSRNQTWRFVATNNITITQEGSLVFYKKVKDDYYDIHTGSSFCYQPGTTHSMDRTKVDDDPESVCSFGLHVCSYEYLKSFGGSRILLVEVDPADIVSVPIDYNNSKLRVCKLKVLREITDPQPTPTTVYDGGISASVG